MTIGLGSTWLVKAHNNGSNTIIDSIEFVPTMVDTAGVTGKNGATNAQSDFVVEEIVRHEDGVSNHSWELKLVYANSFVPATSTTIANVITYVETAITAFAGSGELTT